MNSDLVTAGLMAALLGVAGGHAFAAGAVTCSADRLAARGNASGAPPASQTANSRNAGGDVLEPKLAGRGNASGAASEPRLAARGNDSGKALPS